MEFMQENLFDTIAVCEMQDELDSLRFEVADLKYQLRQAQHQHEWVYWTDQRLYEFCDS